MPRARIVRNQKLLVHSILSPVLMIAKLDPEYTQGGFKEEF
jgi:hypothetical protein